MSAQKLHAYKVLSRLANVKALVAQVALADAVAEESAKKERAEIVSAQREAVSYAIGAGIVLKHRMDLARYELLTRLGDALSQTLFVATQEQQLAAKQRFDRASENLLAKRYHERVDASLQQEINKAARTQEDKAQENDMERWLVNDEEVT